jgi:hypothetical protein
MNTIDTSTYPRELINTDGRTTCLWHRQWEWTMKHYVPTMPRCTICGGICDERLTAHHLCVERQKRGLPILMLDNTPKCGCRKCVDAVEKAWNTEAAAEARRQQTYEGAQEHVNYLRSI